MEINKKNVVVLSLNEYERLKNIEQMYEDSKSRFEKECNDRVKKEINELINEGKVKVINLKTTTDSIIDQSFVASSSDAVIQRVLEMMGITNVWTSHNGTVLSLRIDKIRWFKSDVSTEQFNKRLAKECHDLITEKEELTMKIIHLREALMKEIPELKETPEETEASKPINAIHKLLTLFGK